jgi:flagellar biosynthesis chaperone FliJ
MTQFDELLEVTKTAVAKVGKLTDDKNKLVSLCEQANKNTDEAMASARKAMEGTRELMAIVKKLTEERDRYKALRDIDSHRIGIATQSIDSLEEELRVMQETYEPERV